MKSLTPIVLFVYKRPEHTKRVLKSLSQCIMSNESTLIIYADGPKENASSDELNLIKEVRHIIKDVNWCKELRIIERESNIGLDPNVIEGVTNVVNEFGKVIVLEDDLVCHPMFLKYMNFCLDKYKDNELVMGVSGFSYFNDNTLPSIFLLPIVNSWGWAIWKDNWNNLNLDSNYLIEKIIDYKINVKKFNFGGYDYYSILKTLNNSNKDPWDIRVYLNLFLNNKYYIYPNSTLIRNFGFDGTGVHCGDAGNDFDNDFVDYSINKIQLSYYPKIEDKIKFIINSKKEMVIVTIFNKFKGFLYRFLVKK
jgi:hypothetical protein